MTRCCSRERPFPDEADYQLVVAGCEWALSWAEFEFLWERFEGDLLAPSPVAIERALREYREGA